MLSSFYEVIVPCVMGGKLVIYLCLFHPTDNQNITAKKRQNEYSIYKNFSQEQRCYFNKDEIETLQVLFLNSLRFYFDGLK